MEGYKKTNTMNPFLKIQHFWEHQEINISSSRLLETLDTHQDVNKTFGKSGSTEVKV